MRMRCALMCLTILVVASCKKAPDSGAGSGSGSSGGSSTPVQADATAPASTPDAAGADAAVIQQVDAAAPTKTAAQHESCLDGSACDRGLTCVKYIGVTGAQLASCEIPCPTGSGCPKGQSCVAIKDGPGQVCERTPGGSTGSGSGSAVEPPPGPGSGSGSLPKQTQTCPAGKCAAGLECVEYYGIAGPRGPKFTSCEIRCSGGKGCPSGQRCITIADGPGQVCRP